MPCPEYEAAGEKVSAALRVCYDAARASIDQSCTVVGWPRQGAAWVDLAEALEHYAELARASELPERMIIRLKAILDETLPQDDVLVELRDMVVSFSIETYFKSAQRRSGLGSELATTDEE